MFSHGRVYLGQVLVIFHRLHFAVDRKSLYIHRLCFVCPLVAVAYFEMYMCTVVCQAINITHIWLFPASTVRAVFQITQGMGETFHWLAGDQQTRWWTVSVHISWYYHTVSYTFPICCIWLYVAITKKAVTHVASSSVAIIVSPSLWWGSPITLLKAKKTEAKHTHTKK